jgi:hypothetical protein
MHCTPEEKGNISLCKYALSTPLERIYIYIYISAMFRGPERTTHQRVYL